MFDLHLRREVDFAKQKTEGEIYKRFKIGINFLLFLFLPLSLCKESGAKKARGGGGSIPPPPRPPTTETTEGVPPSEPSLVCGRLIVYGRQY